MKDAHTFCFEGHTVTVRRIRGRWWMTTKDLAPCLGYPTYNGVLKLYYRHRSRFVDGATTMRLLCPKPLRLFSLGAAIAMCSMVQRPIAQRFQIWLLAVVARVNEGSGRDDQPAPQDRVIALESRNRQLLATNHDLTTQLRIARRLSRSLLDVIAAHVGATVTRKSA